MSHPRLLVPTVIQGQAWVPRLGIILILVSSLLVASDHRRVDAAAGTVTLSLVPSTTTAQRGESITVSIVIDAGTVPVTSFQAWISYSTAINSVVSPCIGGPVSVGTSPVPWTTLDNSELVDVATRMEFASRETIHLGVLSYARGVFSADEALTGPRTLGSFQLWIHDTAAPGLNTISFITGTPGNVDRTAVADSDFAPVSAGQNGSTSSAGQHQLSHGNLAVNPAIVRVGTGPVVATSPPTPNCAGTTTTTQPPTGGGGGGGGGGGSSTGTPTGTSRFPTQRPPSPISSRLIGATGSTQATTIGPSRIRLTSIITGQALAEVDVGTISRSGEIAALGFLRDGDLGQTYAIVKRQSDGLIVRVWVSPTSALRFQVPWSLVNAELTLPVDVIAALPLDEQYPQPGQLARRFDGGDDRIFYYDGGMGAWRHIPDITTFQSLGAYWCDVTSADTATFDRMTIGPSFEPSVRLPRGDYPSCRTS